MDIAAENIANMDTTRTESGWSIPEGKMYFLKAISDTSLARQWKMQHGEEGNNPCVVQEVEFLALWKMTEKLRKFTIGSIGCGYRQLCGYTKCGCAEREQCQTVCQRPVLWKPNANSIKHN